MLEVSQLSKEYPTPRGPLTVLSGISFSLLRGDAVAIMGPSGSGKSTLLYILGGLEKPSAGTVTLDGRNPFQLTEKELAGFRNQAIGFIFQDHCLLPQCTVLENVLIPTLIDRDKATRGSAETWAKELLERVGLKDRLDHRPAELSGGERQRVAIARALIRKPVLVLADEPTGNLDRRTAHSVSQLLLELHHQERTILIVVTHSAELARTFPRQMEMIDGVLESFAEARHEA